MILEVTPSFEREPSPGNINLHLLQASGRLEEYIPDIQENFKTILIKVRNKLDIVNVDVVVQDNPRGSIPEIGVGGRVVNAHRVDIDFDPEFERF